MYMELTYKGKSLANSSTPGFSLEEACTQEISGLVTDTD